MSDSVQMPALGESVSEGTVTRWLKQVGERVEVDEPLLEVSTDKVDTEIPSPVAGVLEKILVGEDETVAVGTELAVIGNGTSGGGAPAQDAPAAAEPAAAESPAQPAQPAEAPAPADTAPAEAPSTDVERPAAAPQAEAAPAGGDGSTVQMPALGESVSEGTVTRWLKAEGDTVEVDEPLLEVSTDKVDTEIPSPVAGVIRKILVGEDETVAVGADLVVIGSSTGAAEAPAPAAAPAPAPAPQPAPSAPPAPAPAAQAPAPPAQAPAPAPAPAPQAPAPAAPAPAPAPAPAATASTAPSHSSPADLSVYVTPLVRRLATDNGVDLTTVNGTGVGGRIRKQDVLDAAAAAQAAAEAAKQASAAPAESAAPAPAPVSALRGTTVPMSRLRKVIAKRMVESLQVSAQLTTVVEVDMTRIARLRARAKAEFEAREGVKLSFLPFLALTAVEALKQFPVVNASIDGDTIVYHAQENLGVAVDTERGLLVPVIHGAGDLNIAGLARKIADLAERTRINKVTPDELGGGTFTLTNTGSRGALFDTPIINQPQVAILGTGAIVKRPVVTTDADGGDTIAVRSMIYLALSYDHRIVDGADAARFLVTMKRRLEEGRFESALGLPGRA